MSRKHAIAMLLASLLVGSVSIGVAPAQTVDPCWYGCPKSGCPQCPEGGPIKSQKRTTAASRDESCVQGCKNNNRDRVRDCNIYYPPQSQPVKHRECLDKAKTIFDACMATC